MTEFHFNQLRRKHPEDWKTPLTVTILQTAGPQPWHDDARQYRAQGHTVRQCSVLCGVGFSSMQKFLNPDSKRKAKIRQAAHEKAKRHADPEHMKRRRDYSRKYAQQVAPGRWACD